MPPESQTPDPTQEPQPEQKPPTNPTAGDKKPETEAKFTQADLDRHAAERAKHAKSAERAALLKELGVEDLEAARAALKAAEDARQAQLSETERLQAAKVAAEKLAADARAEAEQSKAQAELALKRAAVIAAGAGRFAKPEAIVKLLDLGALKVAEDGSVTGVTEALEKLAADEPWTLIPAGSGQQTPQRGSVGRTNPPAKAGAGRSDDELRAKYFGGGGRRMFEPKAEGVIPLKEK